MGGFRRLHPPYDVWLVIHPDHHDAANLGENRVRMAAGIGLPVHVIHLPGIALVEPFAQAVEAVGGSCRRDAD